MPRTDCELVKPKVSLLRLRNYSPEKGRKWSVAFQRASSQTGTKMVDVYFTKKKRSERPKASLQGRVNGVLEAVHLSPV